MASRIASDGPVYSVFLAHRGELREIKTIALDPASLTSAHLLQVLLREYHGMHPECVDAAHAAGKPDAQLLIGNQAIDFRESDAARIEILDLGEEWKRCTGLPFVYAPWLLRPGLPNARAVADDLRALKGAGVSRIAEIVAQETIGSHEMRERYLTQHIRFGLGAGEKRGIEKFRELLAKHHFISAGGPPLVYV